MSESDRPDNGSKPSSFSGLTPYPSNPYRLSEIELTCGECEENRPDIKSYDVIHLVGLVFFVYGRRDTHVKCPRCMRGYLCRRILPALLLANVFSPIVFFWWGVQFLRTFIR